MQRPQHLTLSFDDFTLDLTRGCLLCGMAEVRLRPKSFEVLKYLAESGGRLVSKDELIEAVWVDTAVTYDSLGTVPDRRAAGVGRRTSASLHQDRDVRGYIFEADVVRHEPSEREMISAESVGLANEVETQDVDGEQRRCGTTAGGRATRCGKAKRTNDFQR